MEKIYSIINSKTISGCVLRSAYNTHVYGKYKNILLDDPRISAYLIATLDGSGEIVLKDKSRIKLTAGSYYIGSYSDLHCEFSTDEHWHFCSYFFTPVGLDYSNRLVLKDRPFDCAEEERLATQIINLLQTGDGNDVKYANALFTCKFLSLKPYEGEVISTSLKLFQDVIAFIDKNLKTITSIKDIASHFAYSEKHLRSIFKTYAKISPKQYIQKLKLEQICTHLKTSSTSMQELVELYNFCSISHLITSFKKEYGITPAAFKTQTSHRKKRKV